jgi:hypothetical protein
MLFRETVAVYCENHMEHTNTLLQFMQSTPSLKERMPFLNVVNLTHYYKGGVAPPPVPNLSLVQTLCINDSFRIKPKRQGCEGLF